MKQIQTIYILSLVLVAFAGKNALAQVETYNKKYRQTVLKPYCDYCELPLDLETSRFIYRQNRDTNATQSNLFKKAELIARSLCQNPEKQMLLVDSSSGKVVFTRTVELSAGNTMNGFKKMGKCTFRVTIESKENKYRYTITDFIMDGTNRPLETYLESLRHNAKWQQQISFQVISVIEGYYTEKGHYEAGIIDRIVSGMHAPLRSDEKW